EGMSLRLLAPVQPGPVDPHRGVVCGPPLPVFVGEAPRRVVAESDQMSRSGYQARCARHLCVLTVSIDREADDRQGPVTSQLLEELVEVGDRNIDRFRAQRVRPVDGIPRRHPLLHQSGWIQRLRHGDLAGPALFANRYRGLNVRPVEIDDLHPVNDNEAIVTEPRDADVECWTTLDPGDDPPPPQPLPLRLTVNLEVVGIQGKFFPGPGHHIVVCGAPRPTLQRELRQIYIEHTVPPLRNLRDATDRSQAGALGRAISVVSAIYAQGHV